MLLADVAGGGRGDNAQEAVFADQVHDACFKIVLAKRRAGGGEVLDGDERAIFFEDADAERVELRVEDVGTVDGGRHPELFHGDGRGPAAGQVLGDGGEARAGCCGAA